MSVGVKISKRLVMVNSLSSLGTLFLQTGIAIWLQQYLLKRVSPDEYVLIPVLSAVMVFLPLLTTVLSSGIGRYVTEAYAKDDERRVTQIISTMFPILFGAGVLVLIVGGFLSWNVGSILTIAPSQIRDARIMLAIMVFSFAVRLILSPFGVGLEVQQRFVLRNIIQLGTQILRLTVLFILLFGISTSVVWVIVSSTVANLIGLFCTNIFSCRFVPALRFRPSEFRRDLARTLVAFGGWSMAGQLGTMIRSAADPLILNKFATAVDVTSFHLGSLVNTQVRSLMARVTTPLQPSLTAMHATGKKEQLANTYLRIGRFSVWSIMFMVCPFIIFRKEFFELYLREQFPLYASVTTVTVLLLCYLPISYSMYGLNKVCVATAKIRIYMLITSFSQLFNLGLTFYFIGVLHLGAVGSALATFSSGIVFSLFAYCPLSLKIVNIRLGRFFKETILPGVIPGIAGIVGWIIFRMLLCPSNWLELAICVVAGMIIYSVVLFSFCLQPIDKRDLQVVISLIKRRLRPS